MIPKIGETDGVPFDEKIVHEMYTYHGVFWWLIVEREGDEAFGYANLADDDNAEWGYISISELHKIGANSIKHGLGRPFKEIKEALDRARDR